jgi:uncharacterized protein YdbL (DUF1318 family)
MFSDNMSIRRISEYLGPHRNTVRKYADLFRESGLSYEDIEKMTDEELYDRFCRGDVRKPLCFVDLKISISPFSVF